MREVASTSDDEHVIKLTEAVLRELDAGAGAELLAVAERVTA